MDIQLGRRKEENAYAILAEKLFEICHDDQGGLRGKGKYN
jgi:hypothetical protein